MRANEFKAMMLDKIQKELLVNYVTEEFYQEFLEHQKK